ncbi:MAG: c-type cytochrome biogenesis protein CcmI [Aestuariivita sp.]|nr:c-type cytochrome biogenesis protein CcmI [Aestuariivita sp.]
MIWILCLGLLFLASLWVIFPFLRTATIETRDGDAVLSIYSDQLDEVARDQRQGLISESEAVAACSEIERRRARALRDVSGGLSVARRAPGLAFAGVTFIAVISIGGYVWIGHPNAPDQPLAARKQVLLETRAKAGDLPSRIQLMIQRTEEEPQDFDSWWTLARSYAAVGDHANSAEAYRKALALDPQNPGVLVSYAEAMTLANGNKVPRNAEIIFAQIGRDVADPRALYYLALARAQRQDFEGALEDWTALALASQPDAPWIPLVRRDIVNMVRFLKRDITHYLSDATEAEISAALTQSADHPVGDDVSSILRQALQSNPVDYEKWIRLARAEVAAGNDRAAASALDEGRRHYANAPFVLQKFAEAERSLGLDLTAPVGRGPDADDIAAAAAMTEDERRSMIEGMVSGLAARLEENPDDPSGWTMLIRSYRTMGRAREAEEALARARALFEGTEKMQEILTNL